MAEKKQNIIESPDVTKMQEVVINSRTRIYIASGVDPVKAKKRYLERLEFRKP